MQNMICYIVVQNMISLPYRSDVRFWTHIVCSLLLGKNYDVSAASSTSSILSVSAGQPRRVLATWSYLCRESSLFLLFLLLWLFVYEFLLVHPSPLCIFSTFNIHVHLISRLYPPPLKTCLLPLLILRCSFICMYTWCLHRLTSSLSCSRCFVLHKVFCCCSSRRPNLLQFKACLLSSRGRSFLVRWTGGRANCQHTVYSSYAANITWLGLYWEDLDCFYLLVFITKLMLILE